jgi:two-component system response regulator
VGQKYTIIVAEDDPDDQQLMRDALNSFMVSHEIYSVENGIQLLDFLNKRNKFSHVTAVPDLILLDLNMPVMDGFEVLREIKFNPRFKNIPVDVITTSRNPKDEQLALALGADGFYNKGGSPKDIEEVIRKICGAYLAS